MPAIERRFAEEAQDSRTVPDGPVLEEWEVLGQLEGRSIEEVSAKESAGAGVPPELEPAAGIIRSAFVGSILWAVILAVVVAFLR